MPIPSARCLLGALPLMAALLLGGLSAEAREMKGWSIHADDYPVNLGMQRFADAVARVTKGRDTARVHPSGQLAPQNAVLDKLRTGEIDFAEIGIVGYGDHVPALKVLGLPYIFHDSTQMFSLLDGALGELLATELEKVDVILLGWYDGGTRNFYHRDRKLAKIADFRGEKLRVGQTQTHIEMVRSLGAQPVTLAFKDVYAGLERGEIDGAENNLPSYESMGHYKLAPHYTFTQHLVTPEMLLFSKKSWQQLSPQEQAQLREAGRESARFMREEWNRRVKDIQARLSKQGVQFHAAGDHGPLMRRMKPLYESFWSAKDPVSRQVVALILANLSASAAR
ncbi:TRAP transporter substrate-binding protein DctP [Caldimonas tepidiphila]|uniref:TRAP transporter substrate-binding protein DctP n=1 Tax=Caldimonas tepidiphila TaxID=2315841 RepID=UPI000E5A7D29|nr:TRAP transporter substrate-binding protein DctP [Caldimonas tepidiphila]